MARMSGSLSPNLDPQMYDTALARRDMMRTRDMDPMMTVGAGAMPPDSPGSPGSLIDDYMTETSVQPAAGKAINLDHLQGLFEGHRAFAPEMRERQAKCMWRICKHYCEGLLIRDLPCITSVLTVAKANVESGLQEFQPPLVGVLKLLGLPLIKLASSDDLRSIHNLCEVVCAMGQCTECSDHEVVDQAAKSLVAFAGLTRIHTLGEEASETFLQTSFTQRIIERSQVIPIVVAILRDNLEYPENSAAIVEVLCKFSEFSSNSRQMIAAGASELLVTVLTEDFSLPSVRTALEVLWNCLQNEASAKEVLGTWHTVNTLKELLERILVHGCSNQHKETRNEVLVLLNLIIRNPEALPHFLETGVIELLLHLGTSHELGWGDSFVAPFFQLTTDIDFEFKQLVFGVIGQLSGAPEALKLIIEADAMLALVQHLDPNYTQVSVWTSVQEQQLQLQVLRILFSMAPKALTEFDKAGGFTVVLDMLSEGNNEDATEQQEERVPQVLSLVMSLAAEQGFKESMGKCGFILPLLEVVKSGTASHAGTLRRQDALTALSLLCEDCPPNQRLLRKVGGIAVIAPLLQYNARDPNKQEKVVMSAVDCVWNSVVGNPRNEATFFGERGMEQLMALTEGCPLSIRAQVLGTIADLMLNPKALSFMYEWRSESSGRNILQVLIECWREEELRLGHTCPDGVVTDIMRPLLGVEPKGGRPVGKKEKQGAAQRPVEVVPEEKPADLSRTLPPPTVSEEDLRANPVPVTAKQVKGALMGAEDPSMIAGQNDPLFIQIATSDSKAKLFCILRRLDVSKLEDPTPEEQVKLALINSYQAFKESEVWHDIERELDAEGVRPVTPDATFLTAKVEESEIKALEVQSVQQALVKDVEEVRRVDHECFLETVAESMNKDIAQSIKKGRAMLALKKGRSSKK